MIVSNSSKEDADSVGMTQILKESLLYYFEKNKIEQREIIEKTILDGEDIFLNVYRFQPNDCDIFIIELIKYFKNRDESIRRIKEGIVRALKKNSFYIAAIDY